MTMEQRTPPRARAAKKVVHLSPQERARKGKEARATVPRAAHAAFEPSSSRPDPVSLLERQAVTRVPELVPIRYGRMLVSPFTFFRGAALIMASDLADHASIRSHRPDLRRRPPEQFRAVRVTRAGMMFDVNDFDETLPGPWEWDLKRLAASVIIAGRDQGFSTKDCAAAARAVGSTYRKEMRGLAESRNLDVWYSKVDIEGIIAGLTARAAAATSKVKSRRDEQMAAKASAIVAKSRTKDSLQALAKLTTVVDGRRRIISDPPFVVPLEQLYEQHVIDQLLEQLHGNGAQLPPHAAERPPPPPGGLRARRRGAQGRGRGQRRDPGLDPPAPGPGRGRPAVPPGQGGRSVGPRGVRGQEPVRQSR